MPITSDVLEYDPASFTAKQLRRIIEGRAETPEVPPTIAVRLLRMKLGARSANELAALTETQELSLRVRRQAVSELGELKHDDIPLLLERLLDSEEPTIVRGALQALGRTGNEATLQAIQKRSLPEPLKPVANMATMLITARTGIEPPAPPERHRRDPVRFDRKESEAVELIQPAAERVASVISDLDVLDLPLAAAGALEFRCGSKSLMFVPSHLDFLARIPEQVSIVGVVAGFESVETETWLPELFVLVDPRANRSRPEIQLRTRAGRTVYSGTFDTESGAFVVETESGPGVTPIEAIGRYAAGEVTIESARTGLRAQPAIRLDPGQ